MAGLRRWWKAGVAALVAVFALFVLLRPDPLEVEVEAVQRRDLVVSVEEQGRTRARAPYVVAAPVAGRLLRIELEAGDAVSRGQVLARIAVAPVDARSLAIFQADVTAAEARLAAARAVLAEAEGDLALARREEERREELYKTRAVSAEEREAYRQAAQRAEARLHSARAAEAAAQADARSAAARLLGLDAEDDTALVEIRSPVDGRVFRLLEESERVVPAGTALLEVAGAELEVVIDLLTQDAVQVVPGARMLIDGWGGAPVEGWVTRVEPQAFTKISALGVEEQRVNVVGEMREPPAALGAEFRVEAAIEVWRGEDVLSVPASALFQRGGWRVFVVGPGGEVELRALRIGQRGRDHAEVLEGLDEGENVILFPSDLVREGVRVRI